MIRRSRRLNRLQDGASGNASQSTSNGTPVIEVRSNERPLSHRGGRVSSRRVVRTGNGNQIRVVISGEVGENNTTNNEVISEEVETNIVHYTAMINQLNVEVCQTARHHF